MSLSSKEAAETLSDVEQAARRSARAFGYSKAAPHLIMWGVIWVIGYSATDLAPQLSNWIWAVLLAAGCVGGYVLGRGRERSPRLWRFFALFGVVLIFIASTYTIMRPVHGPQLAAFPALLTGAVYAGLGLWLGTRYLITGLAIIALTLGGFFFLHEHMMLWMAFVGGGAMMLTGLWFRQV
jgi:hypothetical protein